MIPGPMEYLKAYAIVFATAAAAVIAVNAYVRLASQPLRKPWDNIL